MSTPISIKFVEKIWTLELAFRPVTRLARFLRRIGIRRSGWDTPIRPSIPPPRARVLLGSGHTGQDERSGGAEASVSRPVLASARRHDLLLGGAGLSGRDTVPHQAVPRPCRPRMLPCHGLARCGQRVVSWNCGGYWATGRLEKHDCTKQTSRAGGLTLTKRKERYGR